MPRQGSNIKKTKTGRWSARFKIRITTLVDGAEHSSWRDKERTFDTRADAENFLREVRLAASRGEVWLDKRDLPVVTLGGIAEAFMEAAASGAPETTTRTRRSLLSSFINWIGEEALASTLSATMLERYAATLPSEGRKAGTRHRKILVVEQMWKWARKRPDLYPGVPEVMEITGSDSFIRIPPPVVRTATPSWEDVDLMIQALRKGRTHGWRHRRLAILLRYTGLRVSQALLLRWSDVKLEHETPYLIARAGKRGSKASKTRVLPIHPQLAALLVEWRTEGEGETIIGGGDEYADGSLARHVFYAAWQDSGVDSSKWDATEEEKESGERSFGSPCHSIRACFKVELLRVGVSDTLADYLLGHSRGGTHGAYVPESAPDTSPWWPQLVKAIRKIPRHRFVLEPDS